MISELWNILRVFRIFFGFFLLVSTSFAGVEIEVTGISNQRGDICVMVFSGKAGFPDDPEKALMKFFVPASKAKGGAVRIKVPDLKKGNLAFVALHDEDRNRKLKKNFLGIPKEGVAVSNYPKLRLPSFEKAAVRNPNGVLKLTLSY